MIKRLIEKMKTLRLYFVIKSKHPNKSKIKLLRESIVLYERCKTTPHFFDLGRKHSIISIYTHIKLRETIHSSYSL